MSPLPHQYPDQASNKPGLSDDVASVTLLVEGNLKAFDIKVVRETLTQLERLVKAVPTHKGPVLMSELRTGSAVCAVQSDAVTAHHIGQVMTELESDTFKPSPSSRELLMVVRDIAKIANRKGVTSINLSVGEHTPVRIDGTVAETAEKLLHANLRSLGSVTGELVSYSVGKNGHITARIRDRKNDATVSISVDESLDSQVRSLLRYQVEAWGVLTRDIRSNIPLELDLHGIEELESQQVSVQEVQDAWSYLDTGGMTAVELVRKLRD